MANPGMPVRLTSAGCLAFVWTLAALAPAGAAAAAKDDPADATEADAETPGGRGRDGPAEATGTSGALGVVTAAPPTGADARPGPTDTVGFSDRLYVRTPGDEIVVFPGARVQLDGAAFPRQTPKSGFYLRRARVELRGWLGRIFYFDVSADVAPDPPPEGSALAPSTLPATDNYLALAPFGDRLILQAGQFDAPFTLENRTSDAYTVFIERSLAVRALGVPRNKEVGAMLHGLLGDGVFYYSAGVFNGDGPGFRNIDNQPAFIGRAALAPLAGREGRLRRLSVGASGWYGRHVMGGSFPAQATAGGVRFLAPQWMTGQPARTLEMREHGYVAAFAGELTIPFGTRFGLRGEGVYKRQQLAETEPALALASGQLPVLGSATFDGIAGYGELWLWLAGDERLLPAPGLQLPARINRSYRRAFDDGLMVALRGELLKEDLTGNQPTLGNPARATTRVISGTAGVTYWRGSFARISLNYTVNFWSGTSETIKALRAQGMLEHELLLRFAIAL
jgi:hypothetical protein